MTGLQKYSIDELANRIEKGSDRAPSYKAEPLLIAKALSELQSSITNLQGQISATSIEIRTNLSKNAEKITKSMDSLKHEIKTFSE